MPMVSAVLTASRRRWGAFSPRALKYRASSFLLGRSSSSLPQLFSGVWSGVPEAAPGDRAEVVGDADLDHRHWPVASQACTARIGMRHSGLRIGAMHSSLNAWYRASAVLRSVSVSRMASASWAGPLPA